MQAMNAPALYEVVVARAQLAGDIKDLIAKFEGAYQGVKVDNIFIDRTERIGNVTDVVLVEVELKL